MPNPIFGSKKMNQSDESMAKDRQIPHPEEPANQGGTGYIWIAPEDAKDAPSFMGPDGRPHPYPPLQINEQGRVNAYRGVEMHGVEPNQFTQEWHDPSMEYPNPAGFDEAVSGYRNMYVEPVPVYIVSPDPVKCFVKWSGRQLPVTDTAVRLVNRRICRKVIILTNTDAANTIFIDSSGGNMSSFAYPLVPGASLRLENTQDEVWGICAPTKTALLGVIEEYEVEADRHDDQPNATQPMQQIAGHY